MICSTPNIRSRVVEFWRISPFTQLRSSRLACIHLVWGDQVRAGGTEARAALSLGPLAPGDFQLERALGQVVDGDVPGDVIAGL